MPDYVTALQALGAALDDVAQRAALAKHNVEAAHAATSALREITRGVQAEVQGHIEDTISSLAGAASRVRESAATISKVSREASQASGSVADAVEQHAKRIADAAGVAQSQAKTKLDELAYLVKDSGNVWNAQVAELIEAIKVGAAPVELLLAQFGDALVQGERLTEFLRGADLHVYQNQIRDLIQDLHTGNAAVADALAVLGQSQLSIAKGFKEVIELYQKGKVSLAFLLEQAEKIRRAMPDSDFADLAGAIEDALRRGDS